MDTNTLAVREEQSRHGLPRNVKRAAVILAGPAVALAPVAAFATTQDAPTIVGGAASTLKSNLLSIGSTVLPYAAAIVALSVGWRFARKFVKG